MSSSHHSSAPTDTASTAPASTHLPPLRLFNTPARKLETFKPLHGNKVALYTCGPTVYSAPHVGNFASYIYWDLLVRVLKAHDYHVQRVINLTDVGHLVSDGDDGEDKLEKGARKTGQTVWEVADHFIKLFQRDFRSLELVEPSLWARATDYVELGEKIVDTLREKGYTYETRDGIYFDTSKFPEYPDFAHLDLAGLQAGARVDFSSEKRNPSDFAVWKFIQPGEKHAMRWDYRGRPGYPGWHLECSTIIHSALGDPIDIHTGGIDHIPVHHTNEIAQTRAAFGHPLAHYWLHCDFLTVNGEKISKSLGNIYTLEDLERAGYSPLDFKLWVLQGHYQSERDFTLESLAAAHQRRLSWRNRIARLYQLTTSSLSEPTPVATLDDINQPFREAILTAVSDNLGSPLAFSIIDQTEDLSLADWVFLDQLFGLGLILHTPRLNGKQKALLRSRAEARAAKDFATSDRLRDELLTLGLTVLDTPDGQIWQYAR